MLSRIEESSLKDQVLTHSNTFEELIYYSNIIIATKSRNKTKEK